MANGELMSGKGYEPNPALRVLNRWFFDKIQVQEAWADQVRELSGRGTVVYILRSLNLLDFLALDHLTKRFELPRIRYVNDLRLGAMSMNGRSLAHAIPLLTRPPGPEHLIPALEDSGSAA